MFGFDRKVHDFSPNNHYQDQLLEDIHKVVLSARIIFGQGDLRKVLLLLHEVVLICHIPSQWFSKFDQEFPVLANQHETCGIGVKLRPHLLEMLANVSTHKLILTLSCLLESLKNDCNEKSHEDCTHQESVGKKVHPGREPRPTTHWSLIIGKIVLIG
jgi:hypothetical protein